MNWNAVKEEERVYHFPEGHTVTIRDVVGFYDSNTTHRLRDIRGKLYIVPKTFLMISLITESGAFAL